MHYFFTDYLAVKHEKESFSAILITIKRNNLENYNVVSNQI